VWQRQLGATSFAVWYNRSTDGGTTWGTPDSIPGAGNVRIIQDQWNIFPLIAERSTSQLVLVWCWGRPESDTSDQITGLQYTTSNNLGQSWAAVQDIPSSGSVTWYPSLASVTASNSLMLTYDGRFNGVFSRKYNGSGWSSETSVSNGVGTYSDRFSSIAFDWDLGCLYAAWCAQSPSHSEYVIVFRIGSLGGSWGSQFVQFAVDSVGVSDLYPSITGWISRDEHNIDIVYQTSNNKIKLNQYSEADGVWETPRLLSSSGQWANTTLQELPNTPEYPIRVWTDQSASPYQVVLSTDGSYSLQMAQPQDGLVLHRRIVVESVRNGSVIWFDLAPLKVVTTANDTVVLPFTKLNLSKPFAATLRNAWDYLGSDTITLPSNARSLMIETDINSYARQDTLGRKGVNIFTSSSFRIEGVMTGQTLSLLGDQQAVSGRKEVNISQQAGKQIKLRMVGNVPAATEELSIGVGDVFVARKR